jgi:hypothetical protein
VTSTRFASLALTLVWAGSATAADPLPPELQLVPPDAGLFVHIDVATVWKSKIGESIRTMPRPAAPKAAPPAAMKKDKMEMEKKKAETAAGKPAVTNSKLEDKPDAGSGMSFYDELLEKVRGATGLTPDDVKSVTFFFPKIKGPGDEASAVFVVTLLKPYDRTKLLAGLASFEKDLANPKETEPGVFEFGMDPKAIKEAQEKGRPRADGIMRLLLTDPTRIVITGPRYKGVPKPAVGDGPISPALREAAAGKTLTVAVNFAQFPEEIKGEDLPAEVRPFKPLIHSEVAMGTAMLKDNVFDVLVRIKAEDARKAGEAEKSLGALVTLGRVLLPRGIQEVEKVKEGPEKAFLPLMKGVLDGLNAAKTAVDGSEATLALKVPADVPAGTLLAMVSGAVGPTTAAARAQSANNLKQLGLAMHNYHDTYTRFPAAAICDKKGKALLSWRVAILPYVEQDNLYKEFKLDEPWDSEHNKKILETTYPKVFALPGSDDFEKKATHYRVFTGKGAGFNQLQSCRIQEITDGTSNTIMIVTAKDAVPWTKPDDLPFDPKADVAKLLHFENGVTQVGFFDGSVRALSDKLKETTWKAMVTIGGGEVVNPNGD